MIKNRCDCASVLWSLRCPKCEARVQVNSEIFLTDEERKGFPVIGKEGKDENK